MIMLADLLALLLTFFVMLLSMNTIQYERWNAIVRSFSAELNPARASFSIVEGREGSIARPVEYSSISLDYLAAVFEETVGSGRHIPGLAVHRLEDRIVISLPNHFLFLPGNQRLTLNGLQIVRNLAENLRQLPNRVSVIGHNAVGIEAQADSASETAEFVAGGWVLSMKQALVVTSALNQAGFLGEITSFGYGNSRFSDLDGSRTLAERLRLNQRVDIAVLDELQEGRGDDRS
jgi:chemotaxis protein MotB